MGALPGGLTSRLLKPFLKQLTRQARRQPSSLSRPTSSKPYEEAKQFARDVWRSTFGHLEREPVYETIPLRRGREIGGRKWPGQYREYHQSTTRTSPLVQSSRFLAGRIRPTSQPLRGPSMISHMGLNPSPARTFATYGGKFAHEVYANVPLGMRALADRIKRQGDGKTRSKAPRRKRIGATEGKVHASLRKYERIHGVSRFGIVKSSTAQDNQAKRAEEFKKYFELAEPVAPVPCVAEVTLTKKAPVPARDKNRTAYLLLPLAPSLSHLLSLPDKELKSSPSSLSDPYTAHPTPDLMLSLLPTQQAYDQHARTRLFPLLDKLGKLVTLSSEEGGWLRTEDAVDVEVVFSCPDVHDTDAPSVSAGEPEALRLVFRGWSEAGVEALVRQDQTDTGRGWWYIYSVPHSPGSITFSGEEDESHGVFSETSSQSSYVSSSLMDLSSLSTTPGNVTPLSTSYASSFHSDAASDVGSTEEQDAWRMPVLTETGSVFTPSTAEDDLEWVEERVWAA